MKGSGVLQSGRAKAAELKRRSKEDAKWKDIQDVEWADLEHFLSKARRDKDKEAFDTAIRVLEALRQQVLTRK